MLTLLVGLIILGVVLYLVQLIPMDGTVKQVIRVIAILFMVLLVISWLTGWSPAGGWGWR
jgi:hypothetical protein